MTTHLKTITADERQRIHRRTLAVVVLSQAFGGAGLAAGISVGALIAQDMLGTDALSGLPTALFTLGAALTAFLLGRVTQRAGRRLALGFGFTAGGVGAIGVIVAAQIDSPILLFASLFITGPVQPPTSRPGTRAPISPPPSARARPSASPWSPPPSARWPAPISLSLSEDWPLT